MVMFFSFIKSILNPEEKNDKLKKWSLFLASDPWSPEPENKINEINKIKKKTPHLEKPPNDIIIMWHVGTTTIAISFWQASQIKN